MSTGAAFGRKYCAAFGPHDARTGRADDGIVRGEDAVLGVLSAKVVQDWHKVGKISKHADGDSHGTDDIRGVLLHLTLPRHMMRRDDLRVLRAREIEVSGEEVMRAR